MKSDSTDYYAKVLSKTNSDANDGYSSIKPAKKTIVNDDENLGYCTISDDRESLNAQPLNHDYASICETTKDLANQTNVDEVYSSIPNDMDNSRSIIQKGNDKNGASKASTPSSITLSPNTALSMSICSAATDTRTLTSSSSDGDSTSNAPIGYNSLRSTDRSQLTISVSNYESLTGSESDSNYESVRYLNAKDRENPYEQLYNESDIKYDTLKRDDTSGSLYATSMKNNDSKNSSLGSTSGSGNDGRTSRSDGKLSTSSSLNLN